MTKINRLTIHGFKSFAHKTDVEFGSKYNCILGPNGSGKSNVGDALCFVLGRISAKSMRAEKGSNLIFNGGKKHKPAKEGTVEIEFDNSGGDFPVDAKHVAVSRTISKKGSSVYRINGKKSTRTEIVELLSHAQVKQNGYNIILQGDITRFVDMPSVERRRIIEQISDISHYEDKKHKALLELGKVDEKLNSASIIMKERKAYLRELKKDRDQALKFKEVKDKIDSYKAGYINIKMQARLKEKEDYEGKIANLTDKVKKADADVDALKVKIEEKRNAIKELNKEIEHSGDTGQIAMQKDIEALKTELIQKKTRVSTLKDEINKIEVRKVQFEKEIEDLRGKNSDSANDIKEITKEVAYKKRELSDFENKITEFRKKHKIGLSGDLETSLADKDKFIEEQQEAVQKVRLQQQELLREKDRIEFQLENIDEQMKKVALVQKEHKDQIKVLKSNKDSFKNASLKLSKCIEQDSSYASQLANARKKLFTLQEEQAKIHAKTQSIQANMSQNNAINYLLKNKNKFGGIHGTIAQLGQVKKKYAQALEAAAGARTNFLVVDDDKIAADCIAHLKSNKLGRASFIPLNKIRANSVSINQKSMINKNGVHDFAINLISYRSEYKKAFEFVFGSTLIVEDLSSARSVGIGRAKMVTLDGNIAEASGVMKGGFAGTRRGASFQEKGSLESLEKIDAEMSDHQSVISKLESKRADNDSLITQLRKEKGELEGEIVKLEKTLHLDGSDLDVSKDVKKDLGVRLKEVDTELGAVAKNIATINRSLAQVKSEKQILRSKLTDVNNPRLLAQLQAFEEGKQKARERIIRGENDLKNLTSQQDKLIAPEIEKINEIIKQHDKEFNTFKKEIADLSTDITAKDKILAVKEKDAQAFYAKYKGLFKKREELNSFISNNEHKIERIRDANRTAEREMNLHSLKYAEIKAKLSVLQDEFEKYKDVEMVTGKTEKELYAEVSKFEAILSQMSAVNMKALEVYDKVEREFNQLVEKKDSLHNEKGEILVLMNEIETMKKEHFMKTFDEANKHFQVIFSQLFKKGDAFLELENKDKPFDGGLGIKVKLTGKRHMDIKSLSGGEKTLTALSFIFAIQEYQPARFYILDEIDAALDKNNAEKLAKLIGSYCDKAQYIVISHNDSVISEADNLYGVSMQNGISKVTSLKI